MSSKSGSNLKNIWKPALVALAVVFLYATVLGRLVEHWWTDENYSHGLLIPLIIGYIIWLKADELKKVPWKPQTLFGGGLIVFALLSLLGGTLGAELFVQRISFVLMLAGLTVWFFGERILRMLAVPFAVLLLAVPVPQIIFNKIAFPLQIYASQLAVWGIRFFSVPTVRKGNVIEILPKGAVQVIGLEVVEACSGIRSLMTLMTLALILAYFTRNETDDRTSAGRFSCLRRPDFWRGAVLMAAAVPIAILTNAGRVTATGIMTYYYGRRATDGLAHDAAGWFVFITALILLIGLNYLLKKIFRQKTEEDLKSQISDLKQKNPKSKIQNPKSVWSVIAVLVLGGVFINWFEQRGEAVVPRRPLAELPVSLGGWEQKGDSIRFSAATESVLRTTDYVMREYVRNGKRANLYVGYYASQKTGATYHSPQNCLPGAGWEMKKPELVRIEMRDGRSFMANRYIIENGQYKEVMIYWYQGRGRHTASEYSDKIYTVLDSVLQRRSDGALVRVMTSVGSDEREATAEAADLATRTAERLSAFVPE